ncbi:serine (or cysteine) peptidase inhibitor, clade H, member 2 isoform X2 [Hypomesus transpacificus]|nr:serine (or cysteine) peptidase inhibitor, clade H, member 2 isoform X2 [Hypomesus transpacificus]
MLQSVSISHLITLLALLVQGLSGASTQEAPASPPPMGDSSWALGLRLYQTLRSESGALNTLFSPLLLASSLGALGRGAGGTTAKQLHDLLQTPTFSKKPGQAGELAGGLQSLSEANGTSFRLHSSSAVFSKQGPQLSEGLMKESKGKFGLKHQTLGQGDSKRDLKQFHAWAKESMGGVEGAPLRGEIQTKTGALVVANALHFKGLWEREFNEDTSDLRTFLGAKYTKVPMMHRAGRPLFHASLFQLCIVFFSPHTHPPTPHRHYEDVENMVQVLELGLWGGGASVVLLMPFHVESLARLDKLLSLDLLAKWLNHTSSTSVAISLPRANLSSTLSLQKQLSALGLTDACDQKTADFSGAFGKNQGNLHLGGVLHWASLELGSEAGQGAAELGDEIVEKKPKVFYADHSFVVLVRDNSTGVLLLLGAVDLVEGEALHDEL